MISFIKLILLFVLIYYLVRIVMRYLLPLFLGTYVNHKMNDLKGDAGRQRHTKSRRKEGEVSVDYIPREKKKNNDRGEYIEYEEISD